LIIPCKKDKNIQGIYSMVDIEKQIAFWKNSAIDDWSVAKQLVNSGKIRHGLFLFT